jgi:hypothetical protein
MLAEIQEHHLKIQNQYTSKGISLQAFSSIALGAPATPMSPVEYQPSSVACFLSSILKRAAGRFHDTIDRTVAKLSPSVKEAVAHEICTRIFAVPYAKKESDVVAYAYRIALWRAEAPDVVPWTELPSLLRDLKARLGSEGVGDASDMSDLEVLVAILCHKNKKPV